MRLGFSVLVVTAAAMAAAPVAAAEGGILGYWSTPDSSTVRIYKCDSGVCAQLVHLAPGSPEKTDKNNPDAAKRKKPLCGLEIGRGFHLVDPSHAKDGVLYDPKSGNTYHGLMGTEGDALKLRGYIGISLFGRTETWKRAPAVGVCAT